MRRHREAIALQVGKKRGPRQLRMLRDENPSRKAFLQLGAVIARKRRCVQQQIVSGLSSSEALGERSEQMAESLTAGPARGIDDAAVRTQCVVVDMEVGLRCNAVEEKAVVLANDRARPMPTAGTRVEDPPLVIL